MSGVAGCHLADALRSAYRRGGTVDLDAILVDGIALHERGKCRFFDGAAERIRQTVEFQAVAQMIADGIDVEAIIASPAFAALGRVLEREESECAFKTAA